MPKCLPLLSLCIPTNGVTHWVIPVLDSIYKQNIDENLFEVVIADDGGNKEFENTIKDYSLRHSNLNYYKTDAKCFLNEIACYKLAKGKFIKFVNHRNVLLDGSIEKLINFVKENEKEKPIVYFSNGAVPGVGDIDVYDNFDSFVRRLQHYSSWSSGMAIWKDDLKKYPDELDKYNELFPHTTILFGDTKAKKYIVDNTVFFEEIDCKKTPKGVYDFFYAFGVEYPGILLDLLRNNEISNQTFKDVKERNLEFIGKWYLLYVVFNKYTAHDISSYKEIFGIFYTKPQMYKAIIRKGLWKIKKEIKKKLGLKV